ncbi:MAG TPA: ParB/RepB/Spo0J family partition protein [Terriglobales bacterium]|nr:ParB/RepB/Spo0J family partition protein [Terriglobales bacterium]
MTTTSTTPAPPADKRKALGRGLESLLPGGPRPAVAPPGIMAPLPSAPAASAPVSLPPPTKVAGAHEQMRELPLGLIDRNPYQTRLHLDEPAMEELVASIRTTGVVQPIVVRPVGAGRFQLIAGQRRWEASRRAGKTAIPAVVREVSDQQAMELTIIENLQRQDLNPMEQARAFDRLGREFGLTQEQMAQRTGIDRATVSNYIRLLKLPAPVQTLVEQGKLSFGHAKVLLSLDSLEMINKLADRVVEQGLSVRALEQLVFGLEHPTEKEEAKERFVDPNVREAQMEMERSLGVRVQIKDRNGKGRIVIEYKSLEDFDRVVEMLSAK